MSKSKFAPLVRGPVRLVISILALITGLYHVSGVAAGAPSSPSPVTPPNTVLVPQGDCGGGGDTGGDYCDPTHLDSYFCPCTQEPCYGDTGGDCYYGWNYWGDCGGGGGPM